MGDDWEAEEMSFWEGYRKGHDEGYRLGFADGEGSLEGSPHAPAYWRAEADGYRRARSNIELGIDPQPVVRNPYVGETPHEAPPLTRDGPF